MAKRLAGMVAALLALSGHAQAFGWTDIYVERAAMAEAGREVCGINNRRLAARYKDRAEFFTPFARETIERQVAARKRVLVGRLINASALRTFCGRIRSKDF